MLTTLLSALNLIPRSVLVALLAAALGCGALWRVELTAAHHQRDQAAAALTAERAQREAERLQRIQAAASAAADYAAERAAQTAAQAEVSHVAQIAIAHQVDADHRAIDAGGRLLQRATLAGAAGGCAAPAVAQAAPASAPAAGTGRVPAELLGQAVDIARRYAAIADQRGIAGSACERSYDALTPAADPR